MYRDPTRGHSPDRCCSPRGAPVRPSSTLLEARLGLSPARCAPSRVRSTPAHAGPRQFALGIGWPQSSPYLSPVLELLFADAFPPSVSCVPELDHAFKFLATIRRGLQGPRPVDHGLSQSDDLCLLNKKSYLLALFSYFLNFLNYHFPLGHPSFNCSSPSTLNF